MTDVSLREVFEKVDEQVDLREQVEAAVPAFDYIIGVRAYLEHVKTGRRKLTESVATLAEDFTRANAARGYAEARFYYFALLSTHLSMENYLYEESKPLREVKGFHGVIDAWKGRPEVRLMKAVRNRVQHGAMPIGTLRVEGRTAAHPDGAGFTAAFDPGNRMWDRALEEAPEHAREYFKNTLQARPDKLAALLEAYEAAIERLCQELEAKFEGVYASELDAQAKLLAKLAEVDQWLSDNGIRELG